MEDGDDPGELDLELAALFQHYLHVAEVRAMGNVLFSKVIHIEVNLTVMTNSLYHNLATAKVLQKK